MSTDTSHDQAVLDRLHAESAKSDGSTGWVFAGDLVPLIPEGKFWETMDRLGLRPVAMLDHETGKARSAFRAVGK